MNRREALAGLAGLPIAAGIPITNVERIPATELGPQDYLVIEHPGQISEVTYNRLLQQTRAIFPNNKTLVLGEGMKLRVVWLR
jgi:hypothetical protein